MTQISSLEESHSELWRQFTLNQSKNCLSHAILLLGSHYLKPEMLARSMAAAILCPNFTSSCENCQSCYLLSLNQHPDLTYITAENNSIKIDQIRAIQSTLYTSAVLANNRVIIIYPSEKLNRAASNALLKILEEPPNNVYFILIAGHLTTIPATIQSRCQLWRLSLPHTQNGYLRRELFRSQEDLFDNLEKFITELLDLQNNKISVSVIATRWNKYEFKEIIELLYFITAEMINNKLTDSVSDTIAGLIKFKQLANYFKPLHLFTQIDKLQVITKNLNQTINSNQLLVLEDFLLSYVPKD